MNPVASVRPFVIPATPPAADPYFSMPGAVGTRADAPETLRSPPSLTTGSIAPTQNSFASVLDRLVTEVGETHQTAQTAARELMSGENVPLHQVMIAGEEASIAFQLMVEVRNKLLESYQELMRMQV